MDTLLMRLAGPMQAWGVQSAFENRDTGREPSKSGVVGLLCAALGRPRSAPLDDLASLRMGVRADVEGRVEQDFQTIATITVLGKQPNPPKISHRFYLSGAAFLVGLEGDGALLAVVDAALQHPVWTLSLGRKACPPALPVWLADGLRPGEKLEQALSAYPWLPDDALTPVGAYLGRPARLRMVLEDPAGEQSRPDQPVSFTDRQFRTRWVRTAFCDTPGQQRGSHVPLPPDP